MDPFFFLFVSSGEVGGGRKVKIAGMGVLDGEKKKLGFGHCGMGISAF